MYKWLNNINTRHSRVHSIFIRTFSTLRKVNTIRSKIRKRDKFFTRLIKHIISYYNNQPLSLPFEKNAIRVISKHNFAKSKKNLCLLIDCQTLPDELIKTRSNFSSSKKKKRAKYFHFHHQREISIAHNRLPHGHPPSPVRGNGDGTVRPRQNGGVGRKFIRIPAYPLGYPRRAKESRIPSIRASNRPRFPLPSSFSLPSPGWMSAAAEIGKSPGIRGSHIAGKPTDWEPCLSLMPARVTSQTNL